MNNFLSSLKYTSFIVAIMCLCTNCNSRDKQNLPNQSTQKVETIAPAVRDQSKIVTRELDLKDFNSINANGGLEVKIKKGDASKVVVECNEESIEQIVVDVNESVLNINTAKNFQAGHAQVNLTTPKLDSISASGHIIVTAYNINADELKILCRQASTIDCSGTVQNLTVTSEDKAFLKLGKLKATNCDIKTSGESFTRIQVTERINADATGMSVINVAGNPKNVSKNTEDSSIFKLVQLASESSDSSSNKTDQ